jgi:hypothetical protein
MGVDVAIILTLLPALALLPKVRAGCSDSARPDPCGGPPARAVPTATNAQSVRCSWRRGNYQAIFILSNSVILNFSAAPPGKIVNWCKVNSCS